MTVDLSDERPSRRLRVRSAVGGLNLAVQDGAAVLGNDLSLPPSVVHVTGRRWSSMRAADVRQALEL